MTDTKRLGAHQLDAWYTESGEWIPSVSLAPHLDAINRVIERMTTGEGRSGFPQRWITGIAPPTERSKPLGLTKEHKYTDREGDSLEVYPPEADNDPGDVAILTARDGSDSEQASIYVTESDSIPLALNILGYDRPSAERNVAGPTEYKGVKMNRVIPSTEHGRNLAIAEAIDLLICTDIYDQRIAQRKTERDARIKRKEDARAALKSTMAVVATGVISTTAIETVQQAINEYKAATDAVGAPSEL